jgi:hypothetical protein
MSKACTCAHDFSGITQSSHGRWYCSVCPFGNISQTKMIAHSVTSSHQSSLSHFKTREATQLKAGRTLLDRFDSVSRIERRASKLFKTWEDRVIAHLFRYMAGDVKASNENHHLLEAERLLEKYELMERFALLELAVWKATCTRHAGEVKVDPKDVKTVEDAIRFVDAIRVAEKQGSGWKDYRTEMRHSNAIEIIMSLVIPFVGKH